MAYTPPKRPQPYGPILGDVPVPPDPPEPPMAIPSPVSQADTLDCIEWLRYEVYTPPPDEDRPGDHPYRLVSTPLDDLGLSAWFSDVYLYGRYFGDGRVPEAQRKPLSHQQAKDLTYARIQEAVRPQ